MPTSNFKLFDENKTNAMTDAEYASANQRLNGVQSGIASSKLQNKFQIQASMVAYAIAQLMVQNGYDATDSTAITTFVSNLSNSVLQKVIDKATTDGALAGTDNTKWMTPALVKSSIAKFAPKLPTILSDETKALFGLDASAVPDDVLAELGKYKQYWWRRRFNPGYQEVKTKLTENQTVTYSSYPNLQYAKRITIDVNTGQYTLVNPKTVVCAGRKNQDEIRASLQEIVNNAPCYVKTDSPLNGQLTYQLFYLPAGSTAGSSSGITTEYTIYMYDYSSTNLYTCISVAKSGVVQAKGVSIVEYNPSHSAWEYLQSNNRTAYPPSGISGVYEYEYLGIPFDNAVTAPKIETGSYVGTATYGAANPNTLTFGFVPKLVFIFGFCPTNSPRISGYNGTFDVTSLGSEYKKYGYLINDWSNATDSSNAKISEHTLSWYSTYDSSSQLNDNGARYSYIAIG